MSRAVVNVAALPVVFWLPVVFTPGRSICCTTIKTNSTNVSSSSLAVAAALPVVFWLPVVFTPGRSIFATPSKLTPPMSRAVAS